MSKTAGKDLHSVLRTLGFSHPSCGTFVLYQFLAFNAIIQGRDVGRVGAASRISRQANARGIYFLAREKIIESPHAVPNGIAGQMIAHEHALCADDRMLSG